MKDQIVNLETQLNTGFIDIDKKLYEIVKPILQLFENGKYRIEYNPSISAQLLTFSNKKKYFWGYFGENSVIFCTQPADTLDSSRIEHYEKQIKAGYRPILMLAAGKNFMNNFDYYVLDGHHKLQGIHNFLMLTTKT